MLGTISAIWGIVGLSLILGSALVRLYPHARELAQTPFAGYHWAALIASLLFMGYAEGYKGFQCRFSPRAAARALYLKNHPTFMRALFAPFFCMSFFHATRKRRMVSYSLTAMIILLIVMVRHLAQPWRGIVDAGVLLGLAWGLISLWIFTAQAFFGQGFKTSPETPNA